jgi:hypothetical protein
MVAIMLQVNLKNPQYTWPLQLDLTFFEKCEDNHPYSMMRGPKANEHIRSRYATGKEYVDAEEEIKVHVAQTKCCIADRSTCLDSTVSRTCELWIIVQTNR